MNIDKLVKDLEKIDGKINDLLWKEMFIVKDISYEDIDKLNLDTKQKTDLYSLFEIYEELSKTKEDEIKNKDKIAIINAEAYLLMNAKEDIYEKNQENIDALSETDKQEFDRLKSEREELVKKIKETLNLEQKNKEESNPKNIYEVRKEMEQIIGKPLFSNIEDFDLKKDASESKKQRFQKLKEELKVLLAAPKTNKKLIDDKRFEMYLIMEVNPFNELSKNLEEPNKSRFLELAKKHNELYVEMVKQKKEEYEDSKDNVEKKSSKKDENEKTKLKDKINIKSKKREDEIRERMAEILSKEGKVVTPYVGIENTNIHDIEYELDDNEKDEFLELKEELKPYLEKKEKRDKRKKRLVKAVKSAVNFFKKHKKIILLVLGLILLAVSMHYLLPSIMYSNSWLWHEAVRAGALPHTGLPKLLNDINLLIGPKIGASFNFISGEWLLANGTILNATAAQSSALAALGKVALSIGGIGTGASVAIINAYKLAKEKIQQRRNKKQKVENNGGTITPENTSVTPETQSIPENTSKENDPIIKDNPTQSEKIKFERESLPSDIQEYINYAIKTGLYGEMVIKILKNMDDQNIIGFHEQDDSYKKYIENKYQEEKGKGLK